MLKLHSSFNFMPETITKCGEIFCNNLKDVTIFCTFCQMKSFQFEDFLLHIQNVHLKNELPQSLSCRREEPNSGVELNVKNEIIPNERQETVLWDNIVSSDSVLSDEDITSYEEESLKVLKTPKRRFETKENLRSKANRIMKRVPPSADEIESEPNKSVNEITETSPYSTKKTKLSEYTCTECYEIFLQKKCLDQHVHELHEGYKCSLCDKRFRRSSHVACHLKTHTTEKKFICPIENCGRGFIDEEYLKRHLEVHTMDRNFVCEYEKCGKAFQTHRRLASHEYTHRIPKKFVCDVCGFSCRSNTVLVTHQRVHTGEKPFSCEVCNKPFISKSALREHMISHSETRPHVCSICNRAFANRRVLIRHSYIHSDEKTFKCKLCESAFKHPNSLQGHMRHVHRDPQLKLTKRISK